MPRRIVDAGGTAWDVMSSGHHTQYGVDEVSLEFRRADGAERERRFTRFSPQAVRSPELALEAASDATLVRLLAHSQPAWTSPDGDYGRTT